MDTLTIPRPRGDILLPANKQIINTIGGRRRYSVIIAPPCATMTLMNQSESVINLWDYRGVFVDTFLGLLPAMWPLFALMALILLARFFLFIRRVRRIRGSKIADIDVMTGEDFERYLEFLFTKLSYATKRTPISGDYGADLILEKDGSRIAVQAKRSKKNVGPKAIQEVVAAKAHYGCSSTMVVTNSRFTSAAKRLARDNKVELWDRERLMSKILLVRATGGEVATEAEVILATDGGTAVCTLCGAPVSTKVEEYCREHAERFNGQVFCYEHQRSHRS